MTVERFKIGDRVIDTALNVGTIKSHDAHHDAQFVVEGDDGEIRNYSKDDFDLQPIRDPLNTFEIGDCVVFRSDKEEHIGTITKTSAYSYHIKIKDSEDLREVSKYHNHIIKDFNPFSYYAHYIEHLNNQINRSAIRSAAIQLYKKGLPPSIIYASDLAYAEIMTDQELKNYVKYLVGLKNLKRVSTIFYGGLIISSKSFAFPPDENSPAYCYITP